MHWRRKDVTIRNQYEFVFEQLTWIKVSGNIWCQEAGLPRLGSGDKNARQFNFLEDEEDNIIIDCMINKNSDQELRQANHYWSACS